MNHDKQSFLPLIKNFAFCLKQIRLYSDKHPLTQQTLKTLEMELVEYFQHSHRLTLGAMRHRLIVDGQMVGDKESVAHELAKDLERLGVDGLILEQGVDIQEITSFVKLISMRSKELEEKGGLKRLFEASQYAHIKLSSGKFALVEEGEVVADESAVELEKKISESVTGQEGLPSRSLPSQDSSPGGGVPVTSLADVIHKIRQERAGLGMPKDNVVLDAEKIVIQLEENPGEVAKAALAEAESEPAMEQTIRRFVKLLVEGLITFLVKGGKDITKALKKVSQELEKALKAHGRGEEFQNLSKKIPQIFEEGTDELRIQMMLKTFQENPLDLKALEKMGQKLFKDAQVRDRLGPALMEELAHQGLSRSITESMLTRMAEKEIKKKTRVTVNADEIEELRRKAALYDASGGDMEKKFQKLELENTIIRHQKERVDAVIRNLAEGLLVVDEEGRVVLMNPAAERLLGIRQTEKVGKPVAEGLKAEHLLALTEGKTKDLGEEGLRQINLESGNEETKRILRASTAVIENQNGQTVGMVSVLSDVTKQKEIDDMKTQFVANVSHELRTPLVAIQKSLTLILDKELGEVPPEQAKFLEIAQRNIGRLSRLINDLLDMSKLEAGKMTLRPKRFLIQGLVQHVISTVETWARDKQIEIKMQIPDTALEIEADPDRMTQVITNLVSNAVKYTPDGGSITVEVKGGIRDPELSDGDFLEVAVQDTGIGISPEDQTRIFDKFVQVSLAQPSGIPSTGLGLTITREIIELHSGKIWVESEVEKGSRFIFRVPVNFKLNEKLRT